MKSRTRFNKETTFIALYDEDDHLITTLETQEELAKYMERPYRSMQSIMSRIRKGKTKTILDKKGNRYKLYLIEK